MLPTGQWDQSDRRVALGGCRTRGTAAGRLDSRSTARPVRPLTNKYPARPDQWGEDQERGVRPASSLDVVAHAFEHVVAARRVPQQHDSQHERRRHEKHPSKPHVCHGGSSVMRSRPNAARCVIVSSGFVSDAFAVTSPGGQRRPRSTDANRSAFSTTTVGISLEQFVDLIEDNVGAVELDVVAGVVDGDELCRRSE